MLASWGAIYPIGYIYEAKASGTITTNRRNKLNLLRSETVEKRSFRLGRNLTHRRTRRPLWSYVLKLLMRILLIAVLLGSPCVALAQNAQDWKFCKADNDTPDDWVVISDCARLIESKELGTADRAKAYYNRGAAHWRKGDFDAAIADENDAIKIDPKFADAYVRRGASYAAKGDMDRAIADYNEAIRLDPKLAKAYGHRGYAYSVKGDMDRAIADYNEAIRLDPKLANAYRIRGYAYRGKGDMDRAIADFTEAIRLDPKFHRLPQSELDAMRARLAGFWNVRPGVEHPEELYVTVRIRLNPDRRLAAPPVVVSTGSSPRYQKAADAAVRAVLQGQPYTMLRDETYEQWKYMDIDFDPTKFRTKLPAASTAPTEQGDFLAAENSKLDAKLKTICRGC